MESTRHLIAPRLALLVCLALGLTDIGRGAEEAPHALVGRPAPELEAERWDGAGSDGQPMLAGLRGKVAALFFFQSWCPGCHSSGFPLFQHLEREFAQAGPPPARAPRASGYTSAASCVTHLSGDPHP